MLKGFLSGLAVSSVALAALGLAVPLPPDAAAGSPAPVVLPGAIAVTVMSEPAGLPVALPASPTVLPVERAPPVGLPDINENGATPRPVAAPATPRIAAAGQSSSPAAPAAGEAADFAVARFQPLSMHQGQPEPAATTSDDRSPVDSFSPQLPQVSMTILLPAALSRVSVPPVRPAKLGGPQSFPVSPAPLVPVQLRTDRLPQIGVAPPEVTAHNDRRLARERFAAPDSRPSGDEPLVTLILVHQGVLPDLPVTLAFDPLAPDAAEAARRWRAAGGEVAILGTGLPPGAGARDAEITLQSHLRTLPEAVALVDLPQGGIGRDRILAAQAIAILAEDGHGLVLHETGLNAPARMAGSIGVAAVTVTARIEPGQDAVATRRMLDRAALRASGQRATVIFGAATRENIDLLTEWLQNGRGREMTLVPLSALLNE